MGFFKVTPKQRTESCQLMRLIGVCMRTPYISL